MTESEIKFGTDGFSYGTGSSYGMGKNNGYTIAAGHSDGCGKGNGGLGSLEGSHRGSGTGNGYTYEGGDSSGAGTHRILIDEIDELHMITDIVDPKSLNKLQFYSKKRKWFVNWDQIWDECNEEQKQHLLLFLPLRVTNG